MEKPIFASSEQQKAYREEARETFEEYDWNELETGLGTISESLTEQEKFDELEAILTNQGGLFKNTSTGEASLGYPIYSESEPSYDDNGKERPGTRTYTIVSVKAIMKGLKMILTERTEPARLSHEERERYFNDPGGDGFVLNIPKQIAEAINRLFTQKYS